jgi:PhnB protein
MVKAIPEGMHNVTPSFAVEGCAEAIEAYKKVFGAVEKNRAMDPSGKKIWHAQLSIGDSNIFVNDYMPEMGMTKPGGQGLWIYTEDPDKMFEQAKAANFKVTMEMMDQFWGDRSGSVMDRWGNNWTIAKRVKEMSVEEMKKAGEEFAKNWKK